MSDKKTLLIKIGLPVAIILGGLLILFLLKLSRPAPKKIKKPDTGILTHVLKVRRESRQVKILGTGTVQAAQEVSVIPQVGGRIVHINPRFLSGGFFRKGEVLFAIEAIDYELARERAKAALARAELDLASIESQARISRLEWERLNKNDQLTPNPLVLNEPQLKNARANLESAAAALKQAEIDLKRTKVRAPFNCRVRSEQVDVGQYVKSGNSVAVVAGTDRAEIVVPLTLEELHWLRIPARGKKNKGSEATVQVAIAGKKTQWKGRLTRSLGEVDTKGRMARVVVTVDDPYGKRTNRSGSQTDLSLGMFVEVILHGETIDNVIAIPRKGLRENDTVWVMDNELKLRIRKAAVARLTREEALITEGLQEGDLLVLTAISGAADGMKLRRVTVGQSNE